MTCTDTSSPTRRAAAAPASVAAFTAPTSPRTMTVTYPAPMYSFPISATLAAFTIASAASTDPMRPFVSMSPRASWDMRYLRLRSTWYLVLCAWSVLGPRSVLSPQSLVLRPRVQLFDARAGPRTMYKGRTKYYGRTKHQVQSTVVNVATLTD